MSCYLRIVAPFRVVTAVAIVLAVQAATTSLAQQSDLKSQVEARQREVRARIEKARREMDDAQRRPWVRGKMPPIPETPAKTSVNGTASGARSRPNEYQFTPGKTFAYVFLLETTKDDRKLHIAGFAVFKVEENLGRNARISARDNLRHVLDLAALEPAFPQRSRMIDATLHVDGDGYEPAVEGTLPNLLGRPVDWFFPPLPDAVTGSRTQGYPVERGNVFTAPPAWDKRNRGFFQWEVKATASMPSQLTLKDSRLLRTDDRSQELVGSGEIVFDRSEGLMARRAFRGTYTSLGRVAQISLTIERLSDQRLRELTNL